MTASSRWPAWGSSRAWAITSQARLVRKAVSTAVALALKQDIPNRLIELPVIVHESPTTAAAPQFQARYKSQMQEKSGGMKAQMQKQMQRRSRSRGR